MQTHKMNLDEEVGNLDLDMELHKSQHVWYNNMIMMIWFMVMT
jgi:hypothetical protein